MQRLSHQSTHLKRSVNLMNQRSMQFAGTTSLSPACCTPNDSCAAAESLIGQSPGAKVHVQLA